MLALFLGGLPMSRTGEGLMGYATDDAEMFSAREILYLCRGKLLGEVRQESRAANPMRDAWLTWKACSIRDI